MLEERKGRKWAIARELIFVGSKDLDLRVPRVLRVPRAAVRAVCAPRVRCVRVVCSHQGGGGMPSKGERQRGGWVRLIAKVSTISSITLSAPATALY